MESVNVKMTRYFFLMGIIQSQPKVSSKDKAILELKVQRDKLKQYEKKVIVTSSSFK